MVQVSIRTEFPWKRKVEIDLKWDENWKERREFECGPMLLAVRTPEYVSQVAVQNPGNESIKVCDSKKDENEKEWKSRGYIYIPCRRQGTYVVWFEDCMCKKDRGRTDSCEAADDSLFFEANFIRANPQVRADAGKVCVSYGPLVYAAEEIDNGENLAALYLDTSKPIRKHWDENLAGGTMVLEASGKRISQEDWREDQLYMAKRIKLEDITITLVPYAYWNNRGEGEMSVWIKELM